MPKGGAAVMGVPVPSPEFCIDASRRSARRNMEWNKTYLLPLLQELKDKNVRGTDKSLALAKELTALLDEKLPPPKEVPLSEVVPSEDDSLMKPIAPEVLDILNKSTEKYATERYLKMRNHESPEDKFFFRIVTSWDYGWQQKLARQPARDVNRGRCAILRDTFYRRNNVGPDPRHYGYPSGGEFSVCSQYACPI